MRVRIEKRSTSKALSTARVSAGGLALSLDQAPDGASFDVPGLVENGLLAASVVLEGQEIGFSVRGVSDDDEITVELVSEQQIVANIFHAGSGADCQAQCDDGTVGRPCVNCEKNGRSVRVCC